MNIGPQPLVGFFDRAVAERGPEVLLRVDTSIWTYADVAWLVDDCAANLAAAGVKAGSRVGLSASNSPEFVGVLFAVLHLGASVAMISTSWRQREVEHALVLVQPTHIVTDGSGVTDLAAVTSGAIVLSMEAIASATNSPRVDAADIALDDLAVMVFSSGTTGLPKAVRHSHRTLWHGTQHWVQTLQLTARDRLQIATPPFHILGVLNLLAVIAAGASVRLHRRFELEAVLRAIESDRVTIEMAVAPIALAIAAHHDLEAFDLSSLRYIMWGATPVTASVAERITRRSGVRILPAYGTSEVPVLAVNPVDRPAAWRLDSVGVAPVGVELRTVDLQTGAVLAPGSIGELQARSASMMVGYLPAEATAESVIDGWYRTGDVGAVDANGWVTITDRVKEMIKVNGFQVAPAEIESVLLGHDDVLDCAVFGVPDAHTGEAPVAAVVLAAGTTTDAEALKALVAASLASYKQVREVTFVEVIPRLPSGKVLRRELKAAHDQAQPR